MTNKHQQRRREAWMARLECEIATLDPSLAGRINWDEALFHFLKAELNPAEAAVRIVGAKAGAALAEAMMTAATKPAPVGEPEFAKLMTDDTARVEAALKWLEDYGNALDKIDSSPNGDDWNETVHGITSILRDGVVPVIALVNEAR